MCAAAVKNSICTVLKPIYGVLNSMSNSRFYVVNNCHWLASISYLKMQYKYVLINDEHMHTEANMHTHTHAHPYTHMYTHTYTHTHIHTHAHTYIHTHTHTHTYTHMHTHTHTHTHTYTHLHCDICMCMVLCVSWGAPTSPQKMLCNWVISKRPCLRTVCNNTRRAP